MQTAIDKFGRVLIPKSMRDHLGIKAGAIVQILEHDHEILLKLVEHKPSLQRKGRVMVFTGEATEDIETAIQKEREDRMKDLW